MRRPRRKRGGGPTSCEAYNDNQTCEGIKTPYNELKSKIYKMWKVGAGLSGSVFKDMGEKVKVGFIQQVMDDKEVESILKKIISHDEWKYLENTYIKEFNQAEAVNLNLDGITDFILKMLKRDTQGGRRTRRKKKRKSRRRRRKRTKKKRRRKSRKSRRRRRR